MRRDWLDRIAELKGDMKAVAEVLYKAGKRGITGWPLMHRAECMNITGRISDLRRRGFWIICRRDGRSRRGKTLYRYWLCGSPKPKAAV